LWSLFSLAKGFRDIGKANQADGKPHNANYAGLWIKKSCQEDGKKDAHDGPNDEYVECAQWET
jgi:hypothetical protein